MSLLDNIFIAIFSKKVGEDNFGNKYYESNNCDYLGQVKRQIIYKGGVEPSKIPPIWHAWMHYMVEDSPNDEDMDKDKFAWQQVNLPNQAIVNSSRLIKNETSKALYNRWEPMKSNSI
jgi:NADH:ubiquinone oxidoreductase subunit